MRYLGIVERPSAISAWLRSGGGEAHTSWMMVLSSSSGRNEKPCRIACLNVPPGGSWPGFVKYTPVKPRWSWPP